MKPAVAKGQQKLYQISGMIARTVDILGFNSGPETWVVDLADWASPFCIHFICWNLESIYVPIHLTSYVCNGLAYVKSDLQSIPVFGWKFPRYNYQLQAYAVGD